MVNTPPENPQPSEAINPMALMEQLTQLAQAITLQQTQMVAMQKAALANPQPATQIITQPVAMTEGVMHPNPIDEKMDGTNYTFWCQAVEMYVKGRERMRHLTGDPAPPDAKDAEFHKWEVNDVVVKGWLINSLEPRLRSKYIRHPTARDVWDALATTLYDGSDETQVFALNRRVSHVKQDGRSIEELYDELHGLWQEIDFRSPNPMVCAVDIEKFNTFIQKTRVYIFLDSLDDHLDGIRAQVLQMNLFPSLEQTYAHIRRESNRQGIMIKNEQERVQNSVAMVTRGYNSREININRPSNFSDKSKLKCSQCGGAKHLKERCFELIGYPEWWKDKKKRQNDRGRANMASTGGSKFDVAHLTDPNPTEPNNHSNEPILAIGGLAASTSIAENQTGLIGGLAASTSITENRTMPRKEKGKSVQGKGDDPYSFGNNCNFHLGEVLYSNSNQGPAEIEQMGIIKSRDWIIDSGATDHMTHEPGDMIGEKKPQKSGIMNANGGIYPVSGAGDVKFSPKLILNNTLLVPSLSTKLVSVGQLTQDLNCVAIMFPSHCVFQDLLTKEIIGHGTKRDGLYYLDGLNTGTMCLAKSVVEERKNKVMLWHKRLGHPSFGYLQKLSPHLFVGINRENFSCKTCVEAKCHRTSYPNSTNQCLALF